MSDRYKSIEEILNAKMEQRFAEGIRSDDGALLDELLGVDNTVSSRKVKESLERRLVRGVPSGGHRTRRRSSETLNHPLTNRGVTKYRAEQQAGKNTVPLQRGGYDGGVEIGFEGTWNTEQFNRLKGLLQAAKERASESSAPELLKIGERLVLVDSSGANAGLHYRYKITLGGVVCFIHHNCPKGRQAVRVRYGATALIGRSLFDVHAAVLLFLSELGFTVTKEVISRIDMQVMTDVDAEELVWLCYDDERVVRRSQNDVLYRNRKQARTFLLGHRGRLQLCIYDKDAELRQMAVSNPVKFQLMAEHCLGSDYSFGQPLTRVEFRLWRDVLRLLDINTVADLRRMETSLVRWLTSHWFRILESPKVRGHENTATVHPVWQAVQDAFVKWFPGESGAVHEIRLNRDNAVKCEPLSLQKQALGCLKTAFALKDGIQESVSSAYQLLCSWVETVKYEFLQGLNERAVKLKVLTGVSAGDCCDVERSRRSVDDWLSALGGGRCYG